MEQEVSIGVRLTDKPLAMVAQTLVSAVPRLVSARGFSCKNSSRRVSTLQAKSLRHNGWGIVGLILLASSASVVYGAEPPAGPWRNTSKSVGYVGSKICAGCHMGIYRSFSKTDMGRSLSLAANSEPAAALKQSVVVHNEKLDRYFDVHRTPDGVYQSEYQLNADGSDAFRNAQKLAYAIGSGRNGTGYLVERGGFLFEAPLSYYSRTNA